MAEVVAGVSAIAGLVEISGKILSIGYGYLNKVAKAPTEMRALLSDVAYINVLLDRLQTVADQDSGSPMEISTLKTLIHLGVFKSCNSLLKTVEKSLKTCEQQQGHDIKLKNLGKRMIWPLKESETRNALEQLGRLKDTLSAALTVDSAAALKRIVETAREIRSDVGDLKIVSENYIAKEFSQRLIEWLCPESSNIEENLEAALHLRQRHTGRWFLESNILEQWIEFKNAFLWVHGIPGCGKTILSATLIEHMQQRCSDSEAASVYFYCDHRNPKAQKLWNLLMTLAVQLVRQSSDCLEDVNALLDTKSGDFHRKIMVAEYISLLRIISLRFTRTFVVIDALDECSEGDVFVEGLRALVSEGNDGTNIQIVVTSRNDINLERLLLPLTTMELSLRGSVGEDVRAFVGGEMERRIKSRKLKLRDPGLTDVILNTLVDRADGLFLQAKLQLEYLCTMTTDRAIKRALHDLPHGLDKTYDDILQQIITKNTDNLFLVRAVLEWLLEKVEAMSLESLAYAVSIHPDDTTLELDNIVTDPEDLAAMCGSLVVVEVSHGVPMIRLAHFSVEEYLSSERLANSPLSFFHMNPAAINLKLAITCCQYLSFSGFFALSQIPDFANFTGKYQFLRYAARNWSSHLRRSRVSSGLFHQKVVPHLAWFLKPNENGDQYEVWRQVLSRSHSYRKTFTNDPPIYFTITFGLQHAFDILLPDLQNKDTQFSCGWTPLTAAAASGQTEILAKLLKAGANPDQAAHAGRRKGLTALHIAAEYPHSEMAALLLSSGASPHVRSAAKTTPLYRAARSGSLDILRMLHKAGADINARSYDDFTPVIEAIENGHLEALKLLLGWGADPNISNSDGDTPLSFARWHASPEIVSELEKALVSSGISSNPEELQPEAPKRISMRKAVKWKPVDTKFSD